MTEFIVHVGPHKTGSTYLQYNLDRSFPQFIQRGIYIPTEWRGNEENPSHVGLTSKLNENGISSVQSLLRQIVASGYSKCVLSSEEFMNCSPESLALLRDAIGDNPIRIVFYVRRWSEMLASVWNEWIVHGGDITLVEMAAGVLRAPNEARIINFPLAIEKFANIFGMDAISLVSYNAVIEHKRDLFVHFCRRFLGLNDVEAQDRKVANQSMKPINAEIVRILNGLDQFDGKTPSASNALTLRDRFDELPMAPLYQALEPFARAISFNDDDQPFAQITKDLRREYSRHFIGPIPDSNLYESKKVTIRYYSPTAAFTPSVQAAIKDLRAEIAGVKPSPKAGLGRLLSFGRER